MAIYIYVFLFIMITGYCLKSYDKKNRQKTIIFLLIFTLIYGFLAGFRANSVGWDTDTYNTIFNNSASTWKDFFNINYNNSWVEPGFIYLCSLIKIFGGDYHVFLVITSLFIVGSYSIFVYRYSNNPLFSIFLAISFPFFYTSMDILRTYIAISFLLLGYKYVEQKKFIKFLFFILLGAAFQRIAIIFLFFYFIDNFKWSLLNSLFLVALTIVASFYIDEISETVALIIGKKVPESWAGSFAGGIRTCLMYLVILLISTFAYKNIRGKEKEDLKQLNYVLFLFLSSIVFINARMAIRILVAFLPFATIAIPKLLRSGNLYNQNDQVLYKFLIIGVSIAYHMYMLYINWQNIMPYVPFWR